MTLGGALAAVVAADDTSCERLATPLRAAGAAVTAAIVNATALATLSAPGYDVAVLDVGREPERFAGLAASLREDPRTRSLPVVAVAAPGLPAERLSALGPVYVTVVEDGHLLQTVSHVVAQRRAAISAGDHARVLDERLRLALERLSALRADAQALAHDARVLSGIVVGFASNLRDGIAGPLDSVQRGHVAQILEAAGDTSALVERFAGAARAHTEMPGAPGAPSAGRRTARRTLLDFVDLARGTLRLFERVAEQKSVAVSFEASEAVALWGDGMQLKQVVTNLLVNALKFTPAGGSVDVAVRIVRGASGAGVSARQQAELVVCDTGPGIPAEDRERVFERGVRLARDERVPGTGIGLAVVREITAAHGGTVRAGEAPRGGASFVVRLPLDMRSRREPAVVLVDDPRAAQRIVAAARERRDWRREPVEAQAHGLAALLEGCRAVVLVPREARAELEELLAAAASSSSGPPAAMDGSDP